jgi:hypothetical protein
MRRQSGRDETTQRVAFLKAGPWAARGETAWKEIARRKANPAMVRSGRTLNLAAVYGKVDASQQKWLRQVLRGHWKRATRNWEDVIRDSFDEALTRYQLYELAIENGYIPLAAIRNEAREDLARLLWSEAARHYLRLYHYVTVAFLASRLELDIGFPCQQPPVREGNQAQFASFLSQHQTWYQDVLLDGWLSFLDDYQVLNARRLDKEVFRDFLKSDTYILEDEFLLWQLAAGAERFLLVLSDLYTTLSRSERPSYGSFYFYWMARFYGYHSTARGFERDSKEPDWSRLLLGSKRLKAHARSTLTTGRANRQYWMLLAKRNADCEKFWLVTRQFLEAHRPPGMNA